MKKAGGITAIIAGIFGILAAGATLLVGGIGAAVNTDNAETVIRLGWGGMLFSFLVIVFGAVALSARSRAAGVLLTVSAIGGMALGGTLAALFMALALIGGILATVGANPAASPGGPAARVDDDVSDSRPPSIVAKIVLGLLAGLVCLVLVSIVSTSSSREDAGRRASTGSSPSNASQAHARLAEVGSTVSTRAFEIRILSAQVLTSIDGPFDVQQPADGGIYIAVQWSYKNISAKPVNTFNTPTIHLLSPGGTKYDSDLAATTALAAQLNLNSKVLSDLNPGLRVTDAEVFEVSRRMFDMRTWKILVDADEPVLVRFANAGR